MEDDKLIRLPGNGVNVEKAVLQRSTDLIHWEDWQTINLSENSSDIIANTASMTRSFYRAVEAVSQE